jgi:HSP20 family protein
MSNIIRKGKLSPRDFSRNEFLTPFDRIFDDMINNMFPTVSRDLGEDFFYRGSYPKVNVINNTDSVMIEAAIPGMDKDGVDVEVHDGVLTIRGSSNQHDRVKDDQYVKREIKRSAFQRSFGLGDNLSHEEIKGVYHNGILTLTIPKKISSEDPTSPIKIEID